MWEVKVKSVSLLALFQQSVLWRDVIAKHLSWKYRQLCSGNWYSLMLHLLMLHQQSGTLSLMKSGHPTPSHPSNHHLKLFFSAVLLILCMCVCGRDRKKGGWGGGERESERERERERKLVVYHKVWDFFFFFLFFPPILFYVLGLVLQRRNGTEQNTLLFS